MAKFDYKKWVTENKYGKLNEQVESNPTCYGCEKIPNVDNLTITDPYTLINGAPYTFTPSHIATGELVTRSHNDLDYPFQNLENGGGYCGNELPFGNFYLQTSIDFITAQCQASASMVNYGPGGSPLTGSDDITGSQTYGTQTCYYCYQGTVVQATGSSNPTAFNYIFDSDCNVVGENVTNTVAGTTFNYIGAQLYMTDSTTVGGTINPDQLTGTTPASFQWTTNPDACGETTSPTGSNSEGEPTGSGAVTGSGDVTGSFGTTGNYTVFDYPSGFDVTQWTVGFIDMVINHPNPCNFLQGRIDNFSGQLQGNIGPLQQNQLMQKLAVCQELFVLMGCGSLQEQSKKYKLDPKASAIIRKMAPKLKGLAKRTKTIKRESKKISTLKNIIRETILELQEIENVSGQSCYYTNSGGAEENQDPNYCAQAGQPCTSGSDTERCICDCTGGSNPGVLRKPSKGIKRAPKRVAISNPTRGIRGKRLKK